MIHWVDQQYQHFQGKQISSLWMNNAPGPYRGPADSQEDEEVAAEDEDDMGVIETYSNYMPTKLKVRVKSSSIGSTLDLMFDLLFSGHPATVFHHFGIFRPDFP